MLHNAFLSEKLASCFAKIIDRDWLAIQVFGKVRYVRYGLWRRIFFRVISGCSVNRVHTQSRVYIMCIFYAHKFLSGEIVLNNKNGLKIYKYSSRRFTRGGRWTNIIRASSFFVCTISFTDTCVYNCSVSRKEEKYSSSSLTHYLTAVTGPGVVHSI